MQRFDCVLFNSFYTSKNSQARTSIIVKTLMEFFCKIKFLTENTIDYHGVMSSTVNRLLLGIQTTQA